MSIWCLHRNQTFPHKDPEGEYCRCLDCGARIPWSWGDHSTRGPWQIWRTIRTRALRLHMNQA